jgi:hypothetical protein
MHPAQLRKLDIGDDKAKIVAFYQLECLGSGMRGFNLESFLLEDNREKVKDALLIVDNEYFFRCFLLYAF